VLPGYVKLLAYGEYIISSEGRPLKIISNIPADSDVEKEHCQNPGH
jgi:hypothetical protein